MKKPQIVRLFEYGNGHFDSELSVKTSVQLNEVIERLDKHVGGKVLERIMNNRNQTIGVRAFQYVGVIHVNRSLSIEVLPKMYRTDESEAEERQTSIDNLFFMLDYCGQIKMPNSHSSQLHRTRGSFFETLIYLYASGLIDCIQNSTHHEYVEQEENLPYIKGKLVMSEHIRQNMTNQSRFYLLNDSFTGDNELNRVFKYVSRMLMAATNNHRNRTLLGQIVSIFDEVSDKKMTLAQAERIHLSRLNDRFDQSLKLSKLFLAGHSLQLNASSYDSFTFLIDMNSLFEDFVATALSKSLAKDNLAEYKVRTQGPRRTFVERTQSEDRGVFEMKPDISVLCDDAVDTIIDTKYKILKDERKLGVSQPDLYQMFAYAKKYNTSDIILLYPQKVDELITETNFYVDDSCIIKIRTFNLQRNLRKDKAKLFEKEILDIAIGIRSHRGASL